MKKLLLLNLVVAIVVVSVLYTACKKPTHPYHPTPSNNRIMSYTKFSTTSLGGLPVNESYTFFYDAQKRLSQILYTSNDTFKISDNVANLSITFTYSNDTIYKVYTAVNTAVVVERDTFLQNSFGQITSAYVPGNFYTYNYFGNLISGITKSVYDSGTIISATSTFTSDNGDLLIQSYNGTLSAVFPDSGLSFYLIAHDTALTPPLNVTWTDFHPLGTVTTTTHIAGGYSDILTGYTTGDPVMIQAIDNYGVIAYDTCIWPGGTFPKESYYVYPDLQNRTGDYLQIESFTQYGANLYQNAHLSREIIDQNGPTTTINYTIDADSKITQTYVVKTDAQKNTYTTVYKLQYETF